MSKQIRPFLLAMTLLFLAACGTQAASPTATAAVPTQMPTAIAALPGPTDTAPPTVIPTHTDTPTITLTSTPGPSPTPSNTPTRTPVPTNTPTPAPQATTGLAIFTPLAPDGATPTSTPPTAVPSVVPTFEVPDSTVNVLLLGLDAEPAGGGSQRTDTLIIVSINQELKTASLLSIPRDLYVYIPGWTMNRINTALDYGTRASYPGGGVGLLKDTILYNFGIPIHYYARIDFEGFQTVVDAIGGIDVPVTCELTDWRLKSPELDPQIEDNWELFTMPPGEHVMDGDTALWYVRSRTNRTADWGRSLRQQQVLHAMLNQGVDVGLVAQAPQLWNAYRDTVETDMDIGRMLQLAALAPAVRENGVQHLYLASKTESWTVPSSGAAVQLPVWEGEGMMRDTFRRLFLPPALTRITRSPITVEIVNASGTAITGTLAAENFSRHGFLPVLSDETVPVQEETTATYFAPNFKSSYDWLFSWVAGIYRGDIELDAETPSEYNYRVVIGRDYDTCLNELYAPQPFLPDEQ